MLAAASAVNVAEEAAVAAPTPIDTELDQAPTDTLAEEDFDHELILAQVPSDVIAENLLEEGEDKRRWKRKSVKKFLKKLARCVNKRSKSKKCRKMYRRARRAAKKVRKAVRKCLKNKFRGKKCKKLSRRLKRAFRKLRKSVKKCRGNKARVCRILRSKLRKIIRRVKAMRKRAGRRLRKMIKKCKGSKSKWCRKVAKWAKKALKRMVKKVKKTLAKRCRGGRKSFGRKWLCRFLAKKDG